MIVKRWVGITAIVFSLISILTLAVGAFLQHRVLALAGVSISMMVLFVLFVGEYVQRFRARGAKKQNRRHANSDKDTTKQPPS